MTKFGKLEPVMVGVAGEYLVAGELSLRGMIASITLRNTRGIDIIVSNKEGSRSITVQVKTNSSTKNSWILNQKSESYFSESHFYIFVNLPDDGNRSKFYIVPSKVVANYIANSHANWLETLGKSGHIHKDNSIRKFDDYENKYLEAWNLIGEQLSV